MNADYLDPINSLNMPEMADMTFAMDFLLRAKEGVRNMSIALTEAASPDVRALLHNHLKQGLQCTRKLQSS